MTFERDNNRLSKEGERRRDAMLRDLTAQMPGIIAGRRRRRRAMAGGVAMALVLTGGVVITLMANTTGNPAPVSAPAPVIVEAPVEAPVEPVEPVELVDVAGAPVEVRPLVDFAIVRTSGVVDPSIIYVRTDVDAINAMILSDDELLRELAAMGRPAGLIRMNGEVRLTRDVVDRTTPADQGFDL